MNKQTEHELKIIKKHIKKENVSYMDLHILTLLQDYIKKYHSDDQELKQWAGIPEFEEF